MTYGDEPAIAIDALAKKIGAKTIVCDFSPLRDGLKWRKELAALCEARARRTARNATAHNVVPCWEASDKLEVGARTLRGRLAKRYPEFLHEFPEVPDDLPKYSGPSARRGEVGRHHRRGAVARSKRCRK